MFHIIIYIVIKPTDKNTAQFVTFSVGKFGFVQFRNQWCFRLLTRAFQWTTRGHFNPKTHIIFVGGCLRLCNSVSLTSLWGFIQGDGRKFLDRFKSYFGSQISQLLNEIHYSQNLQQKVLILARKSYSRLNVLWLQFLRTFSVVFHCRSLFNEAA